MKWGYRIQEPVISQTAQAAAADTAAGFRPTELGNALPLPVADYRLPYPVFRILYSAFPPHRRGCTLAATFSRNPFNEMKPVASDWL